MSAHEKNPASVWEEAGVHRYRTSSKPKDLKASVLENLFFVQGRTRDLASPNDLYRAVAFTVRDRMLDRLIEILRSFKHRKTRITAYLSAEFLMGPHLGNSLLNLGLTEPMRKALHDLGHDLDRVIATEDEPGLGNGGLGRLAACYLESLATVGVPAVGYGIRYEFGMFDQRIEDGWQVEKTDNWLHWGNPWEIHRPDVAHDVGLYGRVEGYRDEAGNERRRWVPGRTLRGVAYDTPVAGHGGDMVGVLRLWKSEAVAAFDVEAFNTGDYYQAVQEKTSSETISKVLYPNDEPEVGKELRLAQQFFFCSCSMQDLLELNELRGGAIDDLPDHFVIQLNDTHPSVSVAELMRLLVDVEGLDWERAWAITRRATAYTNHTLLPEALETWSLPLFARVLPRHLEIIYEINRRFLDDLRARGLGDDRLRRMSLIDEAGEKKVRMAHLATVGSHAVNGVAALHTELLKSTVLRDFHELDPGLIKNVTNGVTPRRWMGLCNPGQTRLLDRKLGKAWLRDLGESLPGLEPLVSDRGFCRSWRKVKRENKVRLAGIIEQRTGVVLDPDSLFDVQVKRIHEYKRQHLNLLHVITLYRRIKADPGRDVVPRSFIFGGKAAPGYRMAKLIIKLVHSVAEVVNEDPDVAGRLKVAFVPDYNVTNAQPVYPAADLSEQISLAGKEASGTGNMKFALNGALTIGTLDGANVEMREAVGAENFFLFGADVDEVQRIKAAGHVPLRWYEGDEELRGVIDDLAGGRFSRGDRSLFEPLVSSLMQQDEYLCLADYRAYVDCQAQVDQAWRDEADWTRKSILNVARMGFFSSDRSIRDYCEKIWGVEPPARRASESKR